MSTKYSLKYGEGFHLYTDMMDSIGKPPDFKDPVYLEVSGASVELYASSDKGNTVTLGIPREIAEAIGLVHRPAGTPTKATFKRGTCTECGCVNPYGCGAAWCPMRITDQTTAGREKP